MDQFDLAAHFRNLLETEGFLVYNKPYTSTEIYGVLRNLRIDLVITSASAVLFDAYTIDNGNLFLAWEDYYRDKDSCESMIYSLSKMEKDKI